MTIGLEHETILASLFDAHAAVACCDAAAVVAGEVEPLLAQAPPSRQREFAAGRACAARVLAALGLPPQPIARGAEGEPLWPSGLVGSISHTEGLCAAVGARSSQAGAVGLDVEIDRLASPAFARRICNEAELCAIHQLGASAEALAPVVFSAKEASYKLQFPLTRDAEAWARIEVLLSAGTFTARFVGAHGKLATCLVRGRWRRALGFIWAGVALP